VKELAVKTSAHTQFAEITGEVQRVVDESGVKEGLCICFVPHTTARIKLQKKRRAFL
jgi:thiamine phosphate synthase YjbQ (UPF0047 family)